MSKSVRSIDKPTPSPSPVSKTLTLPATVQQLDTYIQVSRGQTITISASGRVNATSDATPNDGAYKWVGPNGWGSDPSFNTGRKSPLPRGESLMALCMRIGSGILPIDDGRWTFVGSQSQIIAQESGTIHLAINDVVDPTGKSDWWSNNMGEFTVEIEVE